MCFSFNIPVYFIHSTIKVFKHYFVFISLISIFHIILWSFIERPPIQLFSGAIPWRGINIENSVIRGSKLKGHKPLFWISVNLQVPDEAGKVILLSDYLQEKKSWSPTNYFLYGVFDHGWYDFQLKCWQLCFGFCNI